MKIGLLQRPEPMSVSEFAEKNVILQEGAHRGERFSYKYRPFFRDATDAMGDNRHVCKVVIVSPSQVGKSTAILNFLYWMITYDQDNTLIILDSNKTAEKLAKVRIRPFLRTQVKLDALQKGASVDYDKSASASNISLSAGKNLLLGSARSASDLCSFSCKWLLCDEVSRYPTFIDKEGDPVILAEQRQESYSRPMAILTSTPTTEDCKIWQQYMIGTQNRWSAVCQSCHKHMPVYYKDIDFSDIDNPTYACPFCGEVYDEYTLQYKLHHEYAPDANPNPYRDGQGRVCKSFHIPGTLVPERYSWRFLREKEIAARQMGQSAYQSFVNTSLGEVYYPGIDESIDLNKIIQCRRYYTSKTLPKWVRFVTCGVDTQDNRFETVVIGADANRKHVCFIERNIIPGDLREPQVWSDLLNYLNNFRCVTKDNRELPIQITCIDSGGHFTQDVYAFCLRSPRLRAVKGSNMIGGSLPNDLIEKVSNIGFKAFANGSGRIQVTRVNTSYAKDIIREQMLKIQVDSKESEWVISSDIEARFDIEFFNQMNSEFRENYANGKYKWVLKNGVRNEALDCTVYALTAVDIARLVTGNAAMSCTIEDDDSNVIKDESNNDNNDKTTDNELTLKSLLYEELNQSMISNDTNTDNTKIVKTRKRKL